MTGSDLPLSSSGSTVSTSTASRTRLLGRRPDQDFPGRRSLLESGGDIDGVPGHEALTGTRIASHDLAGIDADANGDLDPVFPLEPFVQFGDGSLHRRGRADGAKRIILVKLRDPEDGHDGIADVLLHRAAMRLERVVSASK